MITLLKKHYIRTIPLLIALFLFGCLARSTHTEIKEGYELIGQSQDRLIAELDNGLIVIASRVPVAPVVSVQVWVETGSVYEQEYSGAGISHFLEHLLCGGSTTTRPESESNRILGKIGAQKNAATGLDGVFYFINAASEHVYTAVDLISDWMLNATIPESEFQREKDVIQQEFSMGEGDPDRIFWRLTQQARYSAHPARHPTIGYIDEFLEITRDHLIDFYRRMYVPNNMIFTVAGDIDPEKVIKRVSENFRATPSSQTPVIKFPVEAVPDSPTELIGRADISRPRLRLAWPGTRVGEKDEYALGLLAEILGRGDTSRLNRRVRDEKQLVTSVSSYNLSFGWGEGFFGIDAVASPGESYEESVYRARAAILKQVDKLADSIVSDEELERAKRNIRSRILGSNQSVREIASRFASDAMASGNPDYIYYYLEQVNQLTAEDVRRAASSYLTGESIITVILLPETGQYRTGPLRRIDGSEMDDFSYEKITLDNTRITEKIRAREKQDLTLRSAEVGNYEFFELKNGLRVAAQRSTVVPQVAMHIYFKGGLLAEEEGREGRSAAAASMLTRGSYNFTAEEFSEEVENLGASISAGSGYNTDYIRASSLSEDWPRIMELMAEAALRPAFADDEWNKVRPRIIASIDRRTDSWYGELSEHFRSAYFSGHQWSQMSSGRRSVVENITSSELKGFHMERINASEMVLSVTGDIVPEEVFKKAEKLFGNIASDPDKRFAPPLPGPPPETIKTVQTAKPVTAVKMGIGPYVAHSSPDYAALRLLSTVISNFPSGWLEQALRGEGPGLVYAVWARPVTGLVPGYFEMTFNTSADLAVEAVNRVLKVLQRAIEAPVPDEDLERAAANVIFSEFSSRQTNRARAEAAGLDLIYGIGDPDGKQFRQQIQQLNSLQVQQAASRHLKSIFILIMSDKPVDTSQLTFQN